MEHPRIEKDCRRGRRKRPADEAPPKRLLAEELNRILDARCLNQAEVARLLSIPQPRVSAIRHYNLRGISMQRLMQALTDLGQRVEIVVSPTDEPSKARIDVVAAFS